MSDHQQQSHSNDASASFSAANDDSSHHDQDNNNNDLNLVANLQLRLHASNLPRVGFRKALPSTFVSVTSISNASNSSESQTSSLKNTQGTRTVEWGETEMYVMYLGYVNVRNLQKLLILYISDPCINSFISEYTTTTILSGRPPLIWNTNMDPRASFTSRCSALSTVMTNQFPSEVPSMK